MENINNSSSSINNLSEESVDYTSIIVTILLGTIVGVILGYFFIKPRIYHGPDSNDIKKEVHTDSKGKYVWDTVITICPLGTVPHK